MWEGVGMYESMLGVPRIPGSEVSNLPQASEFSLPPSVSGCPCLFQTFSLAQARARR